MNENYPYNMPMRDDDEEEEVQPVPRVVPVPAQLSRDTVVQDGYIYREVAPTDDGVSDLFESGADEQEEDVEDVTEVDLHHDILDTDEDGSYGSLFDVDREDIMGEAPAKRANPRGPHGRRTVRVSRVVPPGYGVQGVGQ